MLRKARHRRLVAWLAIAAMWLTIVAPVVSRTLSSPWPDMGWCGGHGSSFHPAAPAPADPATLADHCGYCGLLGHSPLLSSGVMAPLLPSTPAAMAPQVRRTARVAVETILSARPRGPPSALPA